MLEKKLDSFARQYVLNNLFECSNYEIVFYKESSEVNEKAIKVEESGFRYKIFDRNRDNGRIVYFTFRDNNYRDVEWNEKFKK